MENERRWMRAREWMENVTRMCQQRKQVGLGWPWALAVGLELVGGPWEKAATATSASISCAISIHSFVV